MVSGEGDVKVVSKVSGGAWFFMGVHSCSLPPLPSLKGWSGGITPEKFLKSIDARR